MPKQNENNQRVSEIYLLKVSCRYLIIICWLVISGRGIEAQVAPPSYTFIEVTDESGLPLAGAAVVIYDASGEEIRHWLSDDAGRVHIWGYKNELAIREPWLSKSDNRSNVLRITRSGYLTYESVLERNLLDKLPDWGGEAGIKVKVKLARRPKSKISSLRAIPGRDSAHNRPP